MVTSVAMVAMVALLVRQGKLPSTMLKMTTMVLITTMLSIPTMASLMNMASIVTLYSAVVISPTTSLAAPGPTCPYHAVRMSSGVFAYLVTFTEKFENVNCGNGKLFAWKTRDDINQIAAWAATGTLTVHEKSFKTIKVF